MDEFITIPQLAQGFNVSEKVIRHAFKKLLKQNKLTEGEDYVREGYIDELHFVYKIHPGKFAVHSKLFPTPPSVENLATQFATTDSELGSTAATQHIEFDNKYDDLGNKSATQLGSQDDSGAARVESATTSRVEGSKSEGYLDKFLESKDEQVLNLKEHVADLRSQLAKKDEMLAQAQSMLTSMQEGQDTALHLIKLFGERVDELSRRALPSGSKESDHGSNGAAQPKNFATQFATTSDDRATHDDQLGNKTATTLADK
jgi:hypothetical protein